MAEGSQHLNSKQKWSMCYRKRHYETRSQAKKIVNKMKRSTGQRDISIYSCPVCGKYHITHRQRH